MPRLVLIVVTLRCSAAAHRRAPFLVPSPCPGGAAPTASGGTDPTASDRAESRPTSRRRHLPGARDGYSISSTALSLRGAPYRDGGETPKGFDCSGFVQYVFAQHGVSVPRDVRRQFQVGTRIDPTTLEPGDLVFFTTVAPGASHVGISVGGDQFVHAPSGAAVSCAWTISALRSWANRFVGAKRVN